MFLGKRISGTRSPSSLIVFMAQIIQIWHEMCYHKTMADFEFKQRQSQVQVQRLSQNLVYGLKMLQMPTKELRSEIYRVVNENPALEIVRDPSARQQGSEWEGEAQFKSQDYQALLESREDNRETLQQHLMHQLNSMRLTPDE